MKLIFGANGRSGRALFEQIGNHESIALVRRMPEDDFFSSRGIRTAIADALDETAVADIIKESQAEMVISLIGGKNAQGERCDFIGNHHIINALTEHSPQTYFILISSMGCGEQWEHMPPMVQEMLGEALEAKTQAENLLKNSGLNYCILRPCGLNSHKDNPFQLRERLEDVPPGYMSRAGLAAAIAQIMADKPERKIYTLSSY